MGCPKLQYDAPVVGCPPGNLRVAYRKPDAKKTTENPLVGLPAVIVFVEVSLDQKGRIVEVEAYVWNNPLMNSDPTGELVWFAAIMGAFFGAANAMMNDGNILLGALIGGIAGFVGAGVGNLAAGGTFLGSGALSATGFSAGFTVGFTGGFAGGFVGATLTGLAAGQNIGEALGSGIKAGFVGGVIGGITAGIGAGVKAKKAGGDFWSGDGATFETLAPPGTSTEVGQDLEYNNKFARDFSDKHFGEIKGLNELYADGTAPDSYTKVGDRIFNAKGNEVLGVTKYLGDGKSNVYLAQAAFSSIEQLYLTMGHEYLHVLYNNVGFAGGSDFLRNQKHLSIYEWQADQAGAWGMNVKESLYISRMFTKEMIDIPSNPSFHYSKFGFKILNNKPW